MEDEKVEVVRKLRETIFQGHVPAKKIALELGVDYTQLSMMCSEESLKKGKPKFPLILLPKLVRVTSGHDLMETLSALSGGIYTRIDNLTLTNLDDLIEVRELLLKTSRLIETYISAHRDGVITEEEMSQLTSQIRELISCLIALETHSASVYL